MSGTSGFTGTWALALATQVREAWLSVGRRSDAEQVSKWLEERTQPSPAPRKPGPRLPGKKKRPRR
jgi:hypothetical protein